METPLRVGFLGPRCSQLVNPKFSLLAWPCPSGWEEISPRLFLPRFSSSDIAGEMQIFFKERQSNGDFISKASDMLWGGNDFKVDELETSIMQENIQQYDEVVEDETNGGFLKFTATRDWISGDISAPVNKKLIVKGESEKQKKLNRLKYEAIKSELLLLTTGIGAACSVYYLLTFSVEVAVSYALGVLFRKFGIRSEDLKNSMEIILSGTTVSLSSPRLLVPGMMGFFAYKAAALVQVYRDNEDLRLIFPDYEDPE